MSDPDTQSEAQSPEETRRSLVAAGLHFFGLKGFDAASTREIAGMARANIASIGYHFGGKEGLRRACAEHVAATIRSIAGTGLATAPADSGPADPEAAQEAILVFARRAIRLILVDKRVRLMIRFMLRELADPSITLDIVYSAVVEPTHRRLCRLWGTATGLDPEGDAVKLAVFSMVGQALYFRIGQEIILRRMDWKDYGDAEADAIVAAIVANIEAALKRDRMVAEGEE